MPAKTHFKILLSSLMIVALAGCTTIKKVTGQTNDTVLPGQREEIIPPDQTTSKDPIVAGTKAAEACDPTVSVCPPPPKTIQ